MSQFNLRTCKLGVVGLGYVGLPLAVEFGKKFRTVGFDIKAARVAELKKGRDSTLECEPAELRAAKNLQLHDQRQGSAQLPGLHRHGADADRRATSAPT